VASHSLYIDDSGNREYSNDRDYESSGKSRYFVYGGILFKQPADSALAEGVADLKRKYFDTTRVELKSNWLRLPEERERRYCRPFNVSPDVLNWLTDDLYTLVNESELQIIAVVVDKLHMQERYPEPWYPPTVAYEVLMQRVCLAVPATDSVAVTMDEISGKTPKSRAYGPLMLAHHAKLAKAGSSLQVDVRMSQLTAAGFRFVNSAHSHLLQMADLVTYNVHRQFRDHGDAWEIKPAESKGNLPVYPYFEKMERKFRLGPGGRVQGFGIVKLPIVNRVAWAVTNKK